MNLKPENTDYMMDNNVNHPLENIYLTKLTAADFENYFLLVGDEKVMAMVTERTIPIEEAKSNFERILQNNRIHPRFGTYRITDKSTGAFIGTVKLSVEKTGADKAELGYMLLPAYWGKGIGGKVAGKLIEIAKSERQIKRIFAIIDPRNIPSRQILIKNGFYSVELKDFDGLPGEILELKLD